jgi:metal-responsive CopG/Arc/MetJ family transcriptional regulator
MFRNNTKLHQLVLTDNKINEIESTFIDELGELELVKLKDNICVDEDFVQNDEHHKIHKSDLVTRLDKCFDNFAFRVNGNDDEVMQKDMMTVNKVQKITMEIQGKFKLYGEDGEILYAN